MNEIKPNNIYLGDSYELIKSIPDKSIDLIITDPPYEFNCGGCSTGLFKYRDTLKSSYKEIENNGVNAGIDLKILTEWVRVMKKVNIYIWCNKEQIYDYIDFFVKKLGCNWEMLIWEKSNVPPFTSGHFLKDKEYCLYFWETGVKLNINYESGKTVIHGKVNVEDKKQFSHPCIKPIEYIKKLVEISSEVGGVVLDTFLGSGTTCVAAKELGRKYIGFEINEKYFNIAKDRLNGINAKGQMSLLDTDFEQLDLFNEKE